MRKQGSGDGDGDVATAVRENERHVLQVQRVDILSSHAHVQETMDGVDVVVTTPGRGTFLIRKRTGDHPHSRCPLLGFEIRRIDDDTPRQDDRSRGASRCERTSDGPGRRAEPMAVAVDATRHPHWNLALQLAGASLSNSAAREAE